MNDFISFLGRQLADDARTIGPRLRTRYSDERVKRCGTIEEVRQAARRGLPTVMFDFVDGGAGDEVTERRNQSDLTQLEILPRMLTGVATVDLSTTVLGEPIAVPVLASPMGLNGLVHHAGEAGIARAVHQAGSVYVLGSMASYSVEEMAQVAPGPTWFQMYLWKDRGLVAQLMERAAAVGHRVLVLTVDVPVSAGRDRDRRNGFGIPPRMTMRTFAEGLMHPRWSAQFIRYPRMSAASVAGATAGGPQDPVSITSYITSQFDPSVTWDDVAWFRDRWDGPIVIKGILTGPDARRAVAAGAQGISVSNHGGRQLDHAPSAIRGLAEVADAVGGEAELYMDGGIRRGADIFKALAVGARAVLVGRPFVYGLGAGGEAGAHRVIEILTGELRQTMGLAGCRSVAELDRSWIRDRSAAPMVAPSAVVADQPFG